MRISLKANEFELVELGVVTFEDAVLRDRTKKCLMFTKAEAAYLWETSPEFRQALNSRYFWVRDSPGDYSYYRGCEHKYLAMNNYGYIANCINNSACVHGIGYRGKIGLNFGEKVKAYGKDWFLIQKAGTVEVVVDGSTKKGTCYLAAESGVTFPATVQLIFVEESIK
jgi:hypothetical protein